MNQQDHFNPDVDKAQLTKCLKCNTVFIDSNPGQQPELPVPENVEEMKLLTVDSEDPQYSYDDGDLPYWGCPHCKTDGNLIDLEELDQ